MYNSRQYRKVNVYANELTQAHGISIKSFNNKGLFTDRKDLNNRSSNFLQYKVKFCDKILSIMSQLKPLCNRKY